MIFGYFTCDFFSHVQFPLELRSLTDRELRRTTLTASGDPPDPEA